MEQLFMTSCNQAMNFPMNIISHDIYEHNLKVYKERLDKKQLHLFSDEKNAKLDLMEYEVSTQKCLSTSKSSLNELKDHVDKYVPHQNADLSWRFVFLTAPNSRERLYTSRGLLTYILSYHQVMPSFLDFLFPFGRQENTCDLNFSGFRQENRLEPVYKRLQIPKLGRSGRELRICYNLKSIEPYESQPNMPWSMRQAAVYHSLDLETGKAFWVIVKGDKVIQDRIENFIRSRGTPKELHGLEFQGNAFETSLATHMIICNWCNEFWRWYISYLEEALRQKTEHSLVVNVDAPQSYSNEFSQQKELSGGILSPASEKRSRWSISIPKRLSMSSSQQPDTPREALELLRQANVMPSQPSCLPPFESSNKFSFTNFQEVQLIEDKAREILLTLESGVSVLNQLQKHYGTVIRPEHCLTELAHEYEVRLRKFGKNISGIIDDLNMQKSRAVNLLRLVADRKNLLYGLLQFQQMEASKVYSYKAQKSSEKMELMTKDMHVIAIKTKSETVSMRIITLVTLFFLPGTFISTLMSAGIVVFQPTASGQTQKTFNHEALQLFLAICLPMMVVVFIAWYGVYWWIDRKGVGRGSSGDLDQV